MMCVEALWHYSESSYTFSNYDVTTMSSSNSCLCESEKFYVGFVQLSSTVCNSTTGVKNGVTMIIQINNSLQG
jgi:hypothetical protein